MRRELDYETNVVPAVLIGFGMGALINGVLEHSVVAIIVAGFLIGSGIWAWEQG